MEKKKLTDSELIRQYLKADDEDALEALVSRYASGVYSLAKRYIGDADVASDVAQETFVKAWKNLKKFDDSKNFQAWILTIAKNTALDSLKRKAPLPFSSLEDPERGDDILSTIADPTPSMNEIFDAQTLSYAMDRAISDLPFAYREVVRLKYKPGFTFREIAEHLHIPLNTVKSNYRRALIRLRNTLKDPRRI